MYSEHDQTEKLFQEAIKQDPSYDPKIDLLLEGMRIAEKEISDNPEYRKNVRKSPAFEQLTTEWEFTDSLIEVSGKVYIDDPDFEVVLPKNWREAHTDAYGTWYIIPPTQFVSVGAYPVEDTTQDVGEDEDGSIATPPVAPFRLGYGMILPEDAAIEDGEDVIGFYALPEDVNVDFLRPSFTAIDYRLHERYPDELAKIDAAIPVGSSNITRSLHALRDILPTLTIESPDEVEWLAEYINNRLDTDKQWPYVAVLNDRIALEDPYSELEEIGLNQPIEQCAYIGGFMLTQGENTHGLGGTVIFELAAGLDAEKEIEGKLFAPLESVQSIRSLRPRRSLSEQINASRLEKLRAHVRKAIAETAFNFIEPEVDASAAETGFDEWPHLHRETMYERYADQNRILQEVISLVTEARKHLYPDQESAEKDCRDLSKQIAKKFQECELYGVVLSATGETVLRPNMEHGNNEQAAVFRFPFDEPFIRGDPFTSFKGPLLEVVPLAQMVPDINDAALMRYRISPMLLLDDIHGMSVNSSNGAYSVKVELRTHAPIADGTTVIEHIQFERLRKRFDVYSELNRQGKSSRELVRSLQDVERAFYREIPNDFIELRHVEKLHSIAEKITAMQMDDLAIAAFAGLFFEGQALKIEGLQSTMHGDKPAKMGGRFAGIESDYPYTDHERLVFVIRSNDTLQYIPVDSIKKFEF